MEARMLTVVAVVLRDGAVVSSPAKGTDTIRTGDLVPIVFQNVLDGIGVRMITQHGCVNIPLSKLASPTVLTLYRAL